MAAAAAVGVVGAGVAAVALVMRPDGAPPATDPADSVTTSVVDTTPEPLHPMVAVAEEVVAAFDAHDADAAIAALGADRPVSLSTPPTDDADIATAMPWFDATDWHFDLERCDVVQVSRDGVELVRCSVLQSGPWSEVNGADPVHGTFTLELDPGGERFTSIVYGFDFSTWGPRALDPFREFVTALSPEDARSMWEDGDMTSPGQIDLFRLYTRLYADAHG